MAEGRWMETNQRRRQKMREAEGKKAGRQTQFFCNLRWKRTFILDKVVQSNGWLTVWFLNAANALRRAACSGSEPRTSRGRQAEGDCSCLAAARTTVRSLRTRVRATHCRLLTVDAHSEANTPTAHCKSIIRCKKRSHLTYWHSRSCFWRPDTHLDCWIGLAHRQWQPELQQQWSASSFREEE